MVPLERKVDFLKFVLKHDFVEDREVREFFRKLLGNRELISKFQINSGRPKLKFRYKLFLNLRRGIFLFEANGKKYTDTSLLRSLVRLLEVVEHGNLCICIMDKQHMIKVKLNKTCMTTYLNEDLVMDAFLDHITNEYKRKETMEKIDQALMSNNKEEFDRLSLIYKDLLK